MRKYVWKRATSQNFKTENPLLEKGVIGYEFDTHYIKYGDGVTRYNDLPYVNKPKSAYDIAVENGFVGTEKEWLKSLTGKSAYDIAVEEGFVGSKEAWLESLHGESAYMQAVKQGFEGTPSEYYAATVTGVSDQSWGTFEEEI